MPELTGGGIIADINATIDYLQRTYPRTRGQKIGIVGYCMGGRVVYLAASSCAGLSAGVCYYGGAILAPYSDGVTPHRRHRQHQHPADGQLRRYRRQPDAG